MLDGARRWRPAGLERPAFLGDQVGKPKAGQVQLPTHPRDLRPISAAVLTLASDNGRATHLGDHDHERVGAVAPLEVLRHRRILVQEYPRFDSHARIGGDNQAVLPLQAALLGREVSQRRLFQNLLGTQDAASVDQVVDLLPEGGEAGWPVVSLQTVDQGAGVYLVDGLQTHLKTACSSLSSLSKRTSR